MAENNKEDLYEMEEFITFTLPEEDGSEQEYAIVDSFDANGKHYVVASKVEGDTVHEEEAYIYRAIDHEDDIDIESIDDPDEYSRVIEAYEAIYAEEESEEE